jgi:hypothetical protein
MLASLLYPYDLDAPDLIDSWLRELEAGGCIKLYEVNGSKYLEIHDWLDHQKIDRPTRSRLPKFASPPRKLDEASTTDLNPGPRTMDLNLGREASANTREVSSKTGPASSSPDVTDLDVKRVKAPRHGAVSDDKQHIYLRKGTADYEAYAQDYREVVGEEPNTTDQGRWFKIAGAKVA